MPHETLHACKALGNSLLEQKVVIFIEDVIVVSCPPWLRVMPSRGRSPPVVASSWQTTMVVVGMKKPYPRTS